MTKYKLSQIPVKNFWERMELTECAAYPSMPSIIGKVKRIIAIGDIHGDYDLAISSLKLAKLIDSNLNWIANPPDTIVVQVGDQVDSCRPNTDKNNLYDCHNELKPGDKSHDVKILDMFTKLDAQARLKGGAVYSLLGNHEIMNVNGLFDYVSYENYHNFSYGPLMGPSGRKAAFQQGGPVATQLACTRNSIMIIGSNLFVHAALLPSLINTLDDPDGFANQEAKIDYLNNIVRKWLLGKVQLTTDPQLQKILFDPDTSPFWSRVLGKIPANESMDNVDCKKNVEPILDMFQIGNLIIGHTPQLYKNALGINGTCEVKGRNTVHRVDGGFADSFKIFFPDRHVVQVLEILDDNVYNVLTL
jgi:hypothetical protein